MIALLGGVLCADHTFVVPQRVRARDGCVSREFSPYQALHGVVNTRGQVLSLTLCRSTGMRERLLVANHLKRRYEDRSLAAPILYQDNCCQDKLWFEDAFGSEAIVLLDNYHLISRYREKTRQASDPSSLERQRILMNSISSIVTEGTSVQSTPEKGLELHDRITDVLMAFKAKEISEDIPESKRCVNDALLKMHANQRHHFQSCLILPDPAPLTIVDRFQVDHCVRGTHKIENLWRQLRTIFPEK